MAALTLCQQCKCRKIEWIAPDIDVIVGIDRSAYNMVKPLLSTTRTQCRICENDIGVSETSVNGISTKFVYCKCGPISVVVPHTSHRCKDISRMSILNMQNHAIRSECKMHKAYWELRRNNWWDVTLEEVYPYLCKDVMSYYSQVKLLCACCARQHSRGYNDPILGIKVDKITQECTCGYYATLITDNGQLYCKTCFPTDRNVYRLTNELADIINFLLDAEQTEYYQSEAIPCCGEDGCVNQSPPS